MKTLAACLTALALFLAAAPKADASEKYYYSMVLQNDTESPIHYSVKWGEKGRWVSYRLSPGASRIHYLAAGRGYSGVSIKYDSERREEYTRFVTHQGAVAHVANIREGWRVHFISINAGRTLTLMK